MDLASYAMGYSIANAMGVTMGLRTDTRDRMVTSAALLLRERGVARTSVATVLDHSGGPRGSVGFHFPGGRAELLTEALRSAGDRITARLTQITGTGVSPADVFQGICEYYKTQLEASDFTAGCPIGAAAQEAYDDPTLGPIVAGIIEDWAAVLSEALTLTGHDPMHAADLAMLCIASLEGGITMCRVTRSTRPLDVVQTHVQPLLQAPHL